MGVKNGATVKAKKDVVLLGAGHAHSLLLKKFVTRPLSGARVFVIEPDAMVTYTGMLPGFISGLYQKSDLEIDIVRLSARAGAVLIPARAKKIDVKNKRVHFDDRAPVAFDILSINIGINTALSELSGFDQFAQAAKPLGAFATRWHEIVKAGRIPSNICVLGGGIAGVELAFALARAHPQLGTRQVHIIEQNELLGAVHPRLKRKLLKLLAREPNIHILERARPASISHTAVTLADGRTIPATFTLSATGANPYAFLRQSGLADAHTGGFILTHANLRHKDHDDIFAVGDCALIEGAPRARAGVYAVRSAPLLAHNLQAHLDGKRLRNFTPQKDFLKLILLGQKKCVANLKGWVISGALMWRLKDWIDRRFMRLFDPPPASILPEGERMLCGGCGAKVGANPLKKALAQLKSDALGDDAAIITQKGALPTVQTTDHLRAFMGDLFMMARIAALHSLSDIWAMGARADMALLNITLKEMPRPLAERDLEAVIAGFQQECAKAGVRIVGGHTTFGAETSLGMSATGTCLRAPILQKGAREGNLLVLSKPLGTGTILAGAMQGMADGTAIAQAYQTMCQSNQKASDILQGAHAMTDVTGFGLAGHLGAVLEASGLACKIRRDAVPMLEGAEALAARGIRSSLYEANRALTFIRSERGEGQDMRDILLYDPQTSGGLLAALAPKEAERAQTRLAENGYQSAIIGQCVSFDEGGGDSARITIS